MESGSQAPNDQCLHKGAPDVLIFSKASGSQSPRDPQVQSRYCTYTYLTTCYTQHTAGAELAGYSKQNFYCTPRLLVHFNDHQ